MATPAKKSYERVKSDDSQLDESDLQWREHATKVPHASVVAGSVSPMETNQGSEELPNAMEVCAGDVASDWFKGEIQPPEYKDVWFGVAFVVHLFVIVCAASIVRGSLFSVKDDDRGGGSNRDMRKIDEYDNEDDQFDFSSLDVGFTAFLFLSSIVSTLILSILALRIMFEHAEGLIKFSSLFSIAISGSMALLFLLTVPPIAIVCIIWTIVLSYYTKNVWARVPYAAANVRTAMVSVRANLGVAFVALGALSVVVIYWIVWAIAVAGTLQSYLFKAQPIGEKNDTSFYYEYDDGDQETISLLVSFVTLLFMFSFYWTHEVIKNTVRTTISGVVGTWWFSPLANSGCCTSTVYDSCARSLTYSFGSICMGSLIVALVYVIRDGLRGAARNRRAGFLRCIAQCLLFYIERLIEYFNKWAFIYVGLYGYSYIEAGRNAFNMFKIRGWSAIIADNLINRMLNFICLCIGIMGGLVNMFLTLVFEKVENTTGYLGAAFFIGFVIGLSLSSVIMRLLSSAVDGIIVCFAEAPREFRENHPALSHEMETAWSEAWPTIFATTGGILAVSSSEGPGLV